MIDFHSHVLPGIDDGSKDVSESLEMLRLSLLEGTDIIVATPHFYVDRSSITSFLDKTLLMNDGSISFKNSIISFLHN